MNGRLARKWKSDPKDRMASFPGRKNKSACLRSDLLCSHDDGSSIPNHRRLIPDQTAFAEAHVVGRRLTPHWKSVWLMNGAHWHNWLRWCITSSFLCTKRETTKHNTDSPTLNWWHHLAGVTSSVFIHILLTNRNSGVDHIYACARSPRLPVIESKTSRSLKLQQPSSHMECISRGEEHTKGEGERVIHLSSFGSPPLNEI